MERRDDFWDRQQRAPLYEALERHAKRRPHSFHVPGHKMGNSFDREGKERFGSILSLDVTEISGMDDLHQPEGMIAEAQALAAEAFGAEETRFLVGGSTAGNIALIMAVCQPGEKILIQRNCHKSVYNGVILAQATPVYIVPAVDLPMGVAAVLRREDVERALHEHSDARAVFITNPTYYGMGIDLAKMAGIVHRFNIPLLVDEAHGAHYGFHPMLPRSAMQSGVDAAVQSTHKMGTAMTMSSMLHVQGSRIDRNRLYRALSMIQSSSPSYPMMASLDLARRHLVMEGTKEIERILPELERLREGISSLAWLKMAALSANSVFSTLDPFKLLLSLGTNGMTGYQLQNMLEANGMFPELADLNHVLLAASTGTISEDVDSLLMLLEGMEPQQTDRKAEWSYQPGVHEFYFLGEQVMPIHQAIDAAKHTVLLEEAEGKISAEMVIPYPPGIPLLVPGERIDSQALLLLGELRSGQARFHGVKDARLHTIEVID